MKKSKSKRERKHSLYVGKKTLKRRRTKAGRLEKRAYRRNLALELAPLTFQPALKREVRLIRCPEYLNLSAAYKDTIDFLKSIRLLAAHLNAKFTVDFASLRDITPAAALLVVAEFDRWRSRTSANKLRPVDLENWNPSVRRRLKEMGFFKVLGAECNIEDPPESGGDRYLQFITGRGSDGDAAKALRINIDSLGPQLADRGSLYDGLVEAMTNVHQHAYKANSEVKRWWMSASVNVDASKLTVMIVDHGQGIPATLPRSKIWEKVRRFLKISGSDLFKDDAKLIEAAFSVEEDNNRSRTNEEYRGRGLKEDIKGYVESHDSEGRLRVISNRGKYVYERHTTNGERTYAEKVPRFAGTFIEWTIEDYACADASND